MDYSDLKLEYCPFCGAKTQKRFYCHNCKKSFQILTEFGKTPADLLTAINWSNDISEKQQEVILEFLSEMIKVPAGTFVMGLSDNDGKPFSHPEYFTPHRVELSSFYISKFLVTQRQWFAFMPMHTCKNVGDELPVDSISWNDCIEFTHKLVNLSGIPFSLPTEAQWFYVAKDCDNYYEFPFAGSSDLNEVAWTKENTLCSHRPGLKTPTKLGIYDLCGNLSEYCLDRWGKWPAMSIVNPYRPVGEGGGNMVCKGGSYLTNSFGEHSTYDINSRNFYATSSKISDAGLRLAIFEQGSLTAF